MSSPDKSAEEASNPNPNKQPDTGVTKNVPKKGGTPAFAGFFKGRKSKLRGIVFCTVGAFFVGWGGFYYNNRHAPPWVAVLLVFIGSIFESFAARQFVVNFGKSNRWANTCFTAVLLAGSVFSGLDLWFEYCTGISRHLTVYAHTADSPDINLSFTNGFLFTKVDKGTFCFPTNLPFLVVEVSKYEPQFELKLGVFNDSAPRFSSSGFDVEKPEIDVWIADPDLGETLKWSADPKWNKVSAQGKTTNGASVKFLGQRLTYKFPDLLAPGTGKSAPGITFNMQEKPNAVTVAVLTGGKGLSTILYCFKLLAVPSSKAVSNLRFDTNNVIRWNWKYRRVAYRPLDTPIVVSPRRVRLSDGRSVFGTRVDISNPSSSNLYAITLSVEIENGTVPISSPQIELSEPNAKETAEKGGLQRTFEAHMDLVGGTGMRLFTIPVLPANDHRSFWIRGTDLTNSFVDLAVWQSLDSFPEVKYMSNGTWMWPLLSSNSPFWMHTGLQPMDLDLGIATWVGTNGFTNDSQIIPSRP